LIVGYTGGRRQAAPAFFYISNIHEK